MYKGLANSKATFSKMILVGCAQLGTVGDACDKSSPVLVLLRLSGCSSKFDGKFDGPLFAWLAST